MGDRNLEPAKYSAFICEGSRRIFLWEDSHFVTHITSLKSPLVVLTSWERNIHIGLQSLLQNPWANCVFPPVTYYFARILELQKNASLIGSIPHLLSLIFVLQFWYSLTSLLSSYLPKAWRIYQSQFMIMITVLLCGLQALLVFDQLPTSVFSVLRSHLGSHVVYDCHNSFASYSPCLFLISSLPFIMLSKSSGPLGWNFTSVWVSDAFSWLYWSYESFGARVRCPSHCISLRYM